jgi:hypothetical protein
VATRSELTRQAISDVLFEHRRVLGIRDLRAHCTCGWVGPEASNRITEFRTHLVEVIYQEANRD